MKHSSPDIKAFEDLDCPWVERKSVINKFFPSTVDLDWERVFRSDPYILGQLINDILKVDSATPGKPGKRPALDVRSAEERLRQITGDDYTAIPFVDAVYSLLGKNSILWLSKKCDVEKALLYKIMSGKQDVTSEVIERVAPALNKDPSYFAEYRQNYIIGVLYRKLASMPDATVVFYRKLSGG